MAFLLNNSTQSFKSGLISLSEKLDDKNYSTWRYQEWLTIQTLSLEHHLDPSNTPPEIVAASAQASEGSVNTNTGSAGAAVSTPPPYGTPTSNEAFKEWR
ncbi:hypothetical protein PIB30_044144 [Stylosanthes scabra]|uniref:Uncharacterized protein n=1 Tax=Stylosanthes scabra TaxID=79078 RepID=A0ABU6VGG5_9FABA|nr:hypothetical protein [Stylosanthes scabra]